MMKKLLGVLLLLAVGGVQASTSHEMPQPNDVLQVVNATVSTLAANGRHQVTVMAELKNPTDETVDNLVIEARLTDASGKVIDVLNERLYDLTVPAGEQVAFRLQGAAATQLAQYGGAQVRVISAETRPVAMPQKKKEESRSLFWDLAVSWGPMILLLTIWGLFARKYTGKSSNPAKVLLAIQEQNALLTRQTAAVEAIAVALSADKK